MIEQHKVWAIIPAAGIGTRLSTGLSSDRPKQYLEIHGRPMLHHTLSRICASPLIDGVVVGIHRQDSRWSKNPFIHAKILGVYDGGEERSDTVLNGLKFLHRLEQVAQTDWALVHDAVRPAIMQQDIQNLLSQANANKMGAVLGKRLVDTLKTTDAAQAIQQTIRQSSERKIFWRAFTPQVFRLGDLLRAIERALAERVQITDESMAIEHLGLCPAMVEGHAGNHKITTIDDLALANLFLAEFQ